MSTQLVNLSLDRKLQEHEADCRLRANYVKDFIFQILEFKPLDFFQPAQGGGMLISQVDYERLPDIAKKLIEDIEYRIIRGDMFLAIKLMSKTKALELACRYTLAQKFDIRPSSIPWDQVAATPLTVDYVEQQIQEAEAAKVATVSQ